MPPPQPQSPSPAHIHRPSKACSSTICRSWVCAALLALSETVADAAVPEALIFSPYPSEFESWDDQVETPALKTCSEGGQGDCRQAAFPDQHVDDRIDGVRDYYNSDRAIGLISAAGPLPGRSFHSPFKVGELYEGEYMLYLAGILSSKKEVKVTERVNVLDYGCGLGKFAKEISSFGCCNVHCVNIAARQVEEAKKLDPEGTVQFQSYDGHTFPYENETFDVLFFQESYSFHTPNQCEIAQEFFRVLKPGARLIGLDWMAAAGLTEEEYRYWIGPINLAWEASTGTPEGIARCLRRAGFERVNFKDTAILGGIPRNLRPRNQFVELSKKNSNDLATFLEKYNTIQGQLSIDSFSDLHRHLYALEAMSLAIANEMYWEGFVIAHVPSN